MLREKILLAGVALASLAACGTYPDYASDPRRSWEVTAWANARSDGLYQVRTVTVAPDTCYAPGEIKTAPSSLPETIEVQANLVRATNGPCSQYLTDIVHELPAMRIEPDDRRVELVVFADGAERNRTIIDLANAPPVTASYTPRYDPRDPRYVARY